MIGSGEALRFILARESLSFFIIPATEIPIGLESIA